jgi:alcohol dehydrogenase (cytochrome c)
MTIARRFSVVGVPIVLCLAGSSMAAQQVTSDRLAGASREPQQWLTYSGTYDGQRFSPLDQITRTNVGRLALQWVFQTRVRGSHETTPLVIDGVMYLTTPQNHAFAIDVRTGRPLWHYERTLPKEMSLCCGPQNRGFGALGDLLFMGTLDAHVVALDAKTGRVRWDVEAAEANKGYSFTGAPLVVKDKVIIGAAGGEYGIRGFIDAYEATTGKRAWRFYTIPGEGEPGNDTWAGDSWKRGGAPAWVTGAYDPALNTLYWGTGNPGPQMYGANRKGDNLYSDSLVALDADSGTLKWHFQFTPHDVHDWDATHTPILIDETIGGTPRKLVAVANRNGFFYVLDRVTGKYVRARAYTKVTWATGIDESGRPVLVPGMDPSAEGTRVCPSGTGGTNWHSPAYSPATRLMYFFSNERCDTFMADDDLEPPHRAGRPYIGSAFFPDPGEPEEGAVRAVDPRTGATRWEFREFSGAWAGVTATAGGLVFTGDGQGNFIALDADSGRDLWHVPLGASIRTAAISYAVDGRQFITITAGDAIFTFALPQTPGPAGRSRGR